MAFNKQETCDSKQKQAFCNNQNRKQYTIDTIAVFPKPNDWMANPFAINKINNDRHQKINQHCHGK